MRFAGEYMIFRKKNEHFLCKNCESLPYRRNELVKEAEKPSEIPKGVDLWTAYIAFIAILFIGAALARLLVYQYQYVEPSFCYVEMTDEGTFYKPIHFLVKGNINWKIDPVLIDLRADKNIEQIDVRAAAIKEANENCKLK